MNNIEDMRNIIDSINLIMESKEPVDEGVLDDLAASAKHGVKRLATKTKAALGSKKSAGKDKRDSLAKKMLDGWYNWVGLTGKEGTADDLERFLYTKVGFSRNEAQQLMNAVGKNILGNDRGPDNEPDNTPLSDTDDEPTNDRIEPRIFPKDEPEKPEPSTNDSNDGKSNSIKNKELGNLVSSLDTLQNKNFHGGNINLMNFKKMSGDIIDILKKISDPDVSKEDKLLGANAAITGIDFISSNDRKSVVDGYALSTYRARLKKFIDKLNNNATDQSSTDTNTSDTSQQQSASSSNKSSYSTANDNSRSNKRTANDNQTASKTANDNTTNESIVEDIIDDGEIIPRKNLIKFFTDAAGYAYEHNLVGKTRKKDDYGVPHNTYSPSQGGVQQNRGTGQNYIPYSEEEKQNKQDVSQIDKTWRNASKLGITSDDVQDIKDMAKRNKFESLSAEDLRSLGAIGWSFLRTLR